ncbi:MAG: hypothetical protein MJ215_03990 [Spirochaetia bacterium]|nr:hypothetical protein [Spirochaetia bacterium]
MKKTLAFIFILALLAVSYTFADENFVSRDYEISADVSGAYYIDLNQAIPDDGWALRDNIAFKNLSSNDGFILQPYYLVDKTEQWVKGINKGILKGYGDRDIVDNDGMELKKIRCVAFTVNPKGNYNFNVYIKHHDLYVEILD